MVDDLEEELGTNEQFKKLVSKDSHHLDLFVMISFHSLFPLGKQAANVQRQFDYYVFFTFPQASSIAVKFAQLWSNKKLVQALVKVWRD